MFGSFGNTPLQTAVTFTSKAAIESGAMDELRIQRKLVDCRNTRNIRKTDMIHNTWTPEISVDAQTYEVRADGELLTCEPASVLPLAQLYSLF